MELQDQDQLGSPHLEEEMIGGNVDLDLLSLSLKDMQESWEGLRGGEAFPRSTMVGERRENVLGRSLRTKGEEDPLNRSPQSLSSPSTFGILRGGIWCLYNELEAHTHNQIGGSQTHQESITTRTQVSKWRKKT